SHGSTTSLAASPANLVLTCHGKTSTLTLTLTDTGTSALTWSASAPTGLSLSATHGTLKPGASIKLTVRAITAKVAHGTLTIASDRGNAAVPYTVTCS
ncbi:MAG TPA: hypothetical protein VGS80_26365, partial [Ktedonobacterales bacterium]|nr:hypothetical protein [Ktedonobacterales bacterium]